MISVQKVIFPGMALGCFVLIMVVSIISSPSRVLADNELFVPAISQVSGEIGAIPSMGGAPGSIVTPVAAFVEEAIQEILPQSGTGFELVGAESSPADTADGACSISASYPDNIQQWCALIDRYAGEQGVDPNLVAAVMLQESGGNRDAYSKSGAVGLMQVMPRDGLAASFTCINGPCFASRPSMDELFDPEFNIDYGVRMLAGLINRHGDVREALRAYGPMNYGYRYADIILNIMANHP